MKVPTRRWGNFKVESTPGRDKPASMKVPTRRWGNSGTHHLSSVVGGLNESPHPKVGKSVGLGVYWAVMVPQ